METCTDDEQRRILVNNLDPIMRQYDDYLKGINSLEIVVPGVTSTLEGLTSASVASTELASEAEVENILLPTTTRHNRTSGNPNDQLHDAITSIILLHHTLLQPPFHLTKRKKKT